ncbi:hypothetical protein SK128_019552, partial [Halocaridina rubra]
KSRTIKEIVKNTFYNLHSSLGWTRQVITLGWGAEARRDDTTITLRDAARVKKKEREGRCYSTPPRLPLRKAQADGGSASAVCPLCTPKRKMCPVGRAQYQRIASPYSLRVVKGH